MKNLFSLLMIMSLSILIGCTKTDESKIKVGLIAELTGDKPAVGASCKNAAELAVKEINSLGGIDIKGKKYPVELIIEDNAAKPEQAAAAAQKLITQNKVIAIIGPNASNGAIPASEIAEKSKVALITPWSTNPKTTLDAKTGQPKQYVFRACFTDIFEGHVLAKFAIEELKVKRAAIFYDVASEVLQSQSELFKKSFQEAGGKIVAQETYTTGDKDFSAQLTKIKKANPEIVFLPSYYTDVPLQVQQAKRLGLNVPFLGSDAWSTEEIIKMCGKDCEGFYFCNHYSPESSNQTTKRFIENYKKRYNTTPDDIAALTYDSFYLLFKGLQESETLGRDSLRAAISNISRFQGVTGEISFKAGSGDPEKGAVIMQIKEGRFVFFSEAKP